MIGVGVLTAVFFGVDEVAALLVGGVVAAVGLMVAVLIDLGRKRLPAGWAICSRC